MSKRRITKGSDLADISSSNVLEEHGFKLGKTIGKGSYAIVKVALTKDNGLVAIKIVSKFHAPEEYLRKFLPREIEAVTGLSHPNLIKFIQAIESSHRVYIIMEYAEKGTLLDTIRKESYIKEDRSRRWFKQLVDVVEYCHQNGVVHRDIKCDNLLLNHADVIKLSDFGFARARMKPTKEGTYALSETYCGSYAYAAPEILTGVPYYPHMADIWSMGVVLFAMVYGKLPYDDTNYNVLIKQIKHRVTFPRVPLVSKSCRALISKILMPSKHRLTIAEIKADPWYQGVRTEEDREQQGNQAAAAIRISAKKEVGTENISPDANDTKKSTNE